MAEIVLMIGFFLIYFIEEFVHCLCDSKIHDDHDVAIEDCVEECIEEQQVVANQRRKQSVGIHR